MKLIPLAFTALSLFAAASAQAAGSIERGKYLMESIVACGNCHVQRGEKGRPIMEKGLSGGMVFDEEPFKAYAPNITPDPETGIGLWIWEDEAACRAYEAARPAEALARLETEIDESALRERTFDALLFGARIPPRPAPDPT